MPLYRPYDADEWVPTWNRFQSSTDEENSKTIKLGLVKRIGKLDQPDKSDLLPKPSSCDHVEITVAQATCLLAGAHRMNSPRTGGKMTAIIYNFDRSDEGDAADESERLFSALGRYTIAELLELLYLGEEPGFFELMRGLFGLSDESRLILQDFLASVPQQTITAAIDSAGRCVLTVGTSERENPVKGIAR